MIGFLMDCILIYTGYVEHNTSPLDMAEYFLNNSPSTEVYVIVNRVFNTLAIAIADAILVRFIVHLVCNKLSAIVCRYGGAIYFGREISGWLVALVYYLPLRQVRSYWSLAFGFEVLLINCWASDRICYFSAFPNLSTTCLERHVQFFVPVLRYNNSPRNLFDHPQNKHHHM